MNLTSNKARIMIRRLYGSAWLFPIIVVTLLIVMTVLKISGTSLGIYHPIFAGKAKDTNLLLNHPLPIRSDEWLVTSQLTMAQKAAGYPRVNPNIDSGRDMSITGDAPYKDWSAIFKPQNLAFLVLPFENAFAFKWWLLPALTMTGCYFLVLRFLPGRRLFAAAMAIAVSCSPFLFWWYSTGTFGPMFYGFFIILLSLRLINNEPLAGLSKRGYANGIYVLGLAYLLVCFALILYPPFQIPVAFVVVAYLAGAFLKKYLPGGLSSRPSMQKLGLFLASLLLAGVVMAAFIATRSGAISATTNTIYPSTRSIQAGGTPIERMLSTFLQPQLQRPDRGTNYYGNQSEVSNFILLLPFLFLPGFVVLALEYRKTGRVNMPLLLVQLCITLFLLNTFVHGLQPLYRLLLLDKVPHARLWIGFGFAGVLQLLLIISALDRLELRRKLFYPSAALYALACWAILLWVGWDTRAHYPLFVHSVVLIVLLSGAVSLALYCFLSRKALAGALILMALGIGSVYQIHPLYRGLGPLYQNDVVRAIQQVSKPGDSWATTDNLYFENFALISGRNSISGIKPYPDLSFWRRVEGRQGDRIYNRYAHTLFVSTPSFREPLRLVQADFFEIRLTCSPFVTRNVDFVLETTPLKVPCMSLKKTITYPGATFYIYQVHP